MCVSLSVPLSREEGEDDVELVSELLELPVLVVEDDVEAVLVLLDGRA